MKIAGRKNPGAWFRTNKAVSKIIETTEKDSLIAAIQLQCPSLEACFQDMLALALETGVADPTDSFPTNAGSWASRFVYNGIPLQVWMGRWSFTTYALNNEFNPPRYEAKYQHNVHELGKELRKCMARFLHARRQIKDAFDIGTANDGNPSGNPDANEET